MDCVRTPTSLVVYFVPSPYHAAAAALPPLLTSPVCSVAPQFYAQLKSRAESIKVGDPLQPGCRLGPIASQGQYERVMGYVQVREEPGGDYGGVQRVIMPWVMCKLS